MKAMAKGESRFAAEVRLRPFEPLVDEAIFGARLPTAAAKKIRLATATG